MLNAGVPIHGIRAKMLDGLHLLLTTGVVSLSDVRVVDDLAAPARRTVVSPAVFAGNRLKTLFELIVAAAGPLRFLNGVVEVFHQRIMSRTGHYKAVAVLFLPDIRPARGWQADFLLEEVDGF